MLLPSGLLLIFFTAKNMKHVIKGVMLAAILVGFYLGLTWIYQQT